MFRLVNGISEWEEMESFYQQIKAFSLTMVYPTVTTCVPSSVTVILTPAVMLPLLTHSPVHVLCLRIKTSLNNQSR